MMEKLFCFSVFGRKSKASARTYVKSKDLESDMKKTAAISDLPTFVEDQAMPLDTMSNTLTSMVAAPVEVGYACEGVCSSRESPSCDLHAQKDHEAFAGTSQSSCTSMCHQKNHSEEILLNAKEQSGQPTVVVCADLNGLGASAHTEAAQQGSLENVYGVGTIKSIEEARQVAIFHYSPDNIILSLMCNKLACDDDVLGGHVSDPGVYQQGEEMHSPNGLSMEHDYGSLVFPLALEGSANPDVQSHVSGEVGENLSTCQDRLEAHYSITEMIDSRSYCLSTAGSPKSGYSGSADALPVCEGGMQEIITKCHSSRMGEGASRMVKGKGIDSEVGGVRSFSAAALGRASVGERVPSVESSWNRVEEWMSTIEQSHMPVFEPEGALPSEIHEECPDGLGRHFDIATATIDGELARAATRGLTAYTTVAHMAGMGLREVPSLGVFNCLKTLNLSANRITRILAGCLPRSLHTLDLSRNRVSQVEGFRELTRLRVLNLSYNRISRIGHGLANCTLIKELYLAGNKIAEVDGLHRLLKLTVLDLSHNRIATSKALGQLAANYNSLLALNLLDNPLLINEGEDQVQKMITRLTPHVTYLNKKPIKGISVREAAVDTVARAALGSNKVSSSRASRKVSIQASQKKPSSAQFKEWTGSTSGKVNRHRRSHHRTDSSNAEQNDKRLEQATSGNLPS